MTLVLHVKDKDMNIRIVTKNDCPFCVMAKNWFKEHGIEYEEQLMEREEDRLAFYQTLNDMEETIGRNITTDDAIPRCCTYLLDSCRSSIDHRTDEQTERS